MQLTALRRRIYGAFETQKAFATALGWHPNKLNKLLTGKYLPDVDEADAISKLLRLTNEEHCSIFSRIESPIGDKTA